MPINLHKETSSCVQRLTKLLEWYFTHVFIAHYFNPENELLIDFCIFLSKHFLKENVKQLKFFDAFTRELLRLVFSHSTSLFNFSVRGN